MTIEEFQLLHISEQETLIKSTPLIKMPMWMERLSTALAGNAPNALALLDYRLVLIYKNLNHGKQKAFKQLGVRRQI